VNVRQTIFENLYERVHSVNIAIVTSGIPGREGDQDFEMMIREGLIQVENFDRQGSLKLYRLSAKGRVVAENEYGLSYNQISLLGNKTNVNLVVNNT